MVGVWISVLGFRLSRLGFCGGRKCVVFVWGCVVADGVGFCCGWWDFGGGFDGTLGWSSWVVLLVEAGGREKKRLRG